MIGSSDHRPRKIARGKRLLIIVAALWTAACLPVIPSEAQSGILDEERACTGTPPEGQDSECIGIQAGACACSGDSEGKLTAVNIAFVDEINARREAGDPVACDATESTDETCCATGAACVDGRCELLGRRGQQLPDCGSAVDPNAP